jgi:hypothetical protein
MRSAFKKKLHSICDFNVMITKRKMAKYED